MTAVNDGIYDRLVNDSELMSLTADYGDEKAVFTVTPIPPGVNPPFIVVVEVPPGDVPGEWETKDTLGRAWVRQIGCYARASGDPSLVDSMAERVRALFHQQATALTVAGVAPLVCVVTGPAMAPTDTTLYGRIVMVTITALVTE